MLAARPGASARHRSGPTSPGLHSAIAPALPATAGPCPRRDTGPPPARGLPAREAARAAPGQTVHGLS